MKAEMIAFLGFLIFQHQQLLPLLKDHLDDQNGEILPNLLMADITRWLIEQVVKKNKNDIFLKQILETIGTSYGHNDQIDELIVVSFIENLPKEGESGSEIREILNLKLKEQLRKLG